MLLLGHNVRLQSIDIESKSASSCALFAGCTDFKVDTVNQSQPTQYRHNIEQPVSSVERWYTQSTLYM